MAEIFDMGHGEVLEADEPFFYGPEPEFCEPESESFCRAARNSPAKNIDRELFDRIKTEMVMRIYGVSPEKARLIIASAAKADEDDD